MTEEEADKFWGKLVDALARQAARRMMAEEAQQAATGQPADTPAPETAKH